MTEAMTIDDASAMAPQIDVQALEKAQRDWMQRIEEAERDRRDFVSEAERAIKIHRLGKADRKAKATGERLNIAWANYEILRQATYSRPPTVVVSPRFGGGPNRNQLNAVSEVIERTVQSNNERSALHATLQMVRDDLLKVGRGVPWLRYAPTFETVPIPGLPPEMAVVLPALADDTDDAGSEDGEAPEIEADDGVPPGMMRVKASEQVACEFASWRDYLEGKADTWAKVPWVGRRVPMTQDKLADRFGKDVVTRCGVTFSGDDTDKKAQVEGKFVWVWEIWCRDENKVYFLAKDAKLALEVTEPFLAFRGFFPCPEPAMACMVDGTRTPIPEVLLIEDQLVDIDNLSKRISALTSALRVRGFYGKGASSSSAADAIEHAIKSTDDRQVLIPIEAWAANGSAKFEIVWLPIETVVNVIQQCTAMRKEAIDLVYQITGISDVMRGASEASETLGAQQIKAQWGSVRVRSKQAEMTRVARDICDMTAEIICENFDPQTIAEMSVYGFDPQMMQFMRDDKMRSLMLDVETDSTVAADDAADKQARTEFLAAMGQMIQQLMPVIQVAPELLPMAAAMLKFAASGYRVGRELEQEIDKAVQALTARMQAPKQPPQPDPTEQVKAEATQAKSKAEIIKADLSVKEAMVNHATAIAPPPPVVQGGLVQ